MVNSSQLPDAPRRRATASTGEAANSAYGQQSLLVGADEMRKPGHVDTKVDGAGPKERGAYYTGSTVATFLLRWAVVTGQEIVLDPGFGGGVFLEAAVGRIRELGGDPRRQVYGVEVDATTYRAFANRSTGASSTARLLHANFFDVRTSELALADAVVGNPPFIRYQRFTGEIRQTALRRAREAGVELSRLASSWAPFLVHAVQFVKPGGRLAMVAPAELAHAAYARPVLEYLIRAFRTIRILSFAHRLFPDLSEDTVLVLAAGRGEAFEELILIDVPNASALAECADPTTQFAVGTRVDVHPVVKGQERLLHYALPQRTRELYRQLKASQHVAALGDLADIGIGYVTGDNDFFHLSKGTVDVYGLPDSFLRPAVRSGSELAGLRFTHEDWKSLHRAGRANLLLHIANGQRLPDSVQTYLWEGISKGVPNRYKCRARQPWYCVPHVYQADGFLTYMSGLAPRLVANEAGAVAPNALLVLRLYPLRAGRSLDAVRLAARWQTALTALSCELEGHSLGGGMLKLEPTEAGRVAIALPDVKPAELEELATGVDRLLRMGKDEAARERADLIILRHGLGLSEADVRQLRDGWLLLRGRRLNR